MKEEAIMRRDICIVLFWKMCMGKTMKGNLCLEILSFEISDRTNNI